MTRTPGRRWSVLNSATRGSHPPASVPPAGFFTPRIKGVNMPAKSQSQRRWAFGVKGEKWAREHHYDNPGKLPKKAKPKKTGGTKKGTRKMPKGPKKK